MRENLIVIERALNAASKAGAFTLRDAVEVINSFNNVVNFIGQHVDLSEPEVKNEEVVEEVKEVKPKRKTVK